MEGDVENLRDAHARTVIQLSEIHSKSEHIGMNYMIHPNNILNIIILQQKLFS